MEANLENEDHPQIKLSNKRKQVLLKTIEGNHLSKWTWSQILIAVSILFYGVSKNSDFGFVIIPMFILFMVFSNRTESRIKALVILLKDDEIKKE